MKVCIISPFSHEPDLTAGGVEAVTAALVPALASLPEITEVNVVCFGPAYQVGRRQLTENAAVWFLRGQKHFKLPTRAAFDLLQAWNFVRRHRPTVIHGQGIDFMGDLATGLTPASIVSAHGLVHVEAGARSGSSVRDRARVGLTTQMVVRVLERARVVISTSDYDSTALRGYVRGEQIAIPNPVSSLFLADEWQEASGHVLLFAGVMQPRKNVQGLLRAFSKVARVFPEAKLLLAGPRPDKAYCQSVELLVSELGLRSRVEMLGFLSNAALASVVRNSAGVVLFSWEETSPTIIAQAMSSAKPVVASSVGGIPEMVHDGETGFLVSPGDEDNMARRLKELLGSRHLRREMGLRSNAIARHRFDARSVAVQTLTAYRHAIDGN